MKSNAGNNPRQSGRNQSRKRRSGDVSPFLVKRAVDVPFLTPENLLDSETTAVQQSGVPKSRTSEEKSFKGKASKQTHSKEKKVDNASTKNKLL